MQNHSTVTKPFPKSSHVILLSCMQENSYQALVITDGANTYTVFTYNCDMMGWSGYTQHAVVGYNARGDSFTNHPVSGFEVINTAVACPNNLFYQVAWSNIVYKISQPPDFKRNQLFECFRLIGEDNKHGSNNIIEAISGQLEPCPCSAWQAMRDWGRFRSEQSQGLCFIQRFPLVLDSSKTKFTQECCYRPWG